MRPGYVDADGDGWRELPDGGKMDLSVIPQYSRSMEVRSVWAKSSASPSRMSA